MRRFVIAASLAVTATAAAAQSPPGSTTLQMDSDRSTVTVAVGNSMGQFGVVAGALQYNQVKPEESTLALSLDLSSINEQPVRGAFDVEHFPEMRIISASAARKSASGENLPTNVTIGTITKPVLFQVTFKNMADGVVAMHAEATLKGADFKIKGGNIPLAIDAPFNRVGGN